MSSETRPSVPKVKDLHETLLARSYPGRGLVAARLPDERLCLSYCLTGRSAASRSRSFAASPSGDVRIEDTSGGTCDDLRHYVAAVRRGCWTVVGNGDQVEPLASALVVPEPRCSGRVRRAVPQGAAIARLQPPQRAALYGPV